MEQESRRPYTLREWGGGLGLAALMAAVLYVTLWLAEYAADYFGLAEHLRTPSAIAVIAAVALMFFPAFWAVLFGLGALAALVATVTYIVHFQIAPAFGFAVLTIALAAGAHLIVRRVL